MKSLYNYLEESLLDDLNDLEQSSDKAVKNANSIGSEYRISYIEDYDGIKNLEPKKLKDYFNKTPWDQTNFKVLTPHNTIGRKSNKSETILCNILLGLDKSSLSKGWLSTGWCDDNSKNLIYELFNDLLNKHLNKLYKSALQFNPDIEMESFSLDIRKSEIGSRMFIEVCIGNSGHYIRICLVRKEMKS